MGLLLLYITKYNLLLNPALSFRQTPAVSTNTRSDPALTTIFAFNLYNSSVSQFYTRKAIEANIISAVI